MQINNYSWSNNENRERKKAKKVFNKEACQENQKSLCDYHYFNNWNEWLFDRKSISNNIGNKLLI